jgi:hypothetical protein
MKHAPPDAADSLQRPPTSIGGGVDTGAAAAGGVERAVSGGGAVKWLLVHAARAASSNNAAAVLVQPRLDALIRLKLLMRRIQDSRRLPHGKALAQKKGQSADGRKAPMRWASRPTCANILNRNQPFSGNPCPGRHAIMTSSSFPSRAVRRPIAIAALVVAAVLVLPGTFAWAQNTADTSVTSGASKDSPVEEFSQQLETFQKSVPDLNKAIQDSAGTIDSATDVAKARAEIDKLRETVSTLLGAVSDNGPVSQLGAKALAHVRDKLKTLSQETRFKPEERQYLVDQWRKLQDQTESATKELDDARGQFVALLQTLQENEDFIGELLEIRQAEKALQVIRGLTHDIRDASTQLNKLIGGIKPPGA